MLRTEGPCADCEPIQFEGGCWIAAGAFVGLGAVVPPGTRVKAYEVWKRRE